MLDLAVPQLPDDFENLRPRRVHPAIDLLVGLDRHHEFELLGVHLALFSLAAFIRPPATGAASAFQAGVISTIHAAAALRTVISSLLGSRLPTVKTCATIDPAGAAIGTLRSIAGATVFLRLRDWRGTGGRYRFTCGNSGLLVHTAP